MLLSGGIGEEGIELLGVLLALIAGFFWGCYILLAKKVGEDDTVMLEMVDKAVQGVRNEAWVRVDVAQEMVHLIDQLTQLYAGQDNIGVSAIPATPGTVHIETPSGMVDASLRTQLSNLREYFDTNLTENV